ncbi:hypothetical protein C2G38_2226584 [Gigaspora rosea]|uniref:Uncharacterized protein n=1 Tax=Gigaspora rosea TaxID=44941 RepID=A0A397U6E0_9GLOM|nr:hypothetical protein C2G38_2226584 [Gigaspora rosea]
MWVAGMAASVEPLGGYLNRQPKVADQPEEIKKQKKTQEHENGILNLSWAINKKC